jgi:hypothetical protein
MARSLLLWAHADGQRVFSICKEHHTRGALPGCRSKSVSATQSDIGACYTPSTTSRHFSMSNSRGVLFTLRPSCIKCRARCRSQPQRPIASPRPATAAASSPASAGLFHLVLVSPRLDLSASIRRRMRQATHAITHTALNSLGGCQEAFVWDVQSVVQPLYHLQT